MSEQSFNVKFVQEVEKYPFLYNYNLSQYSRKDITEVAWNNIGKEMNLSGAACKEKWKNLRAVFVRHMKPAPSGSGAKKKKYYLTDVMQFVLPYVKTTTTPYSSNLPERTTLESEEEIDTSIVEKDNEASNLSSAPTDCQPNNPLFKEIGKTSTRKPKNLSSAETQSQPTTSSTAETRADKRKRPLDEVDKTFVSFLKERQKQGHEVENTRKMFLLSLLDEVTNMSDQQWRLFKRRTLNIIDEIMTPTKTYIHQFQNDLREPFVYSGESSLASPPSSQFLFPCNSNQAGATATDSGEDLSLQELY